MKIEIFISRFFFLNITLSITQGTLLYQVSDPWCVFVSSSVGFTMSSVYITLLKFLAQIMFQLDVMNKEVANFNKECGY